MQPCEMGNAGFVAERIKIAGNWGYLATTPFEGDSVMLITPEVSSGFCFWVEISSHSSFLYLLPGFHGFLPFPIWPTTLQNDPKN